MKNKKTLAEIISLLMRSYISDRYFQVKHEDTYISLRKINAGVPQGSVLGPILYLLYTYDIPRHNGVTIGTFADDTTLLSIGASIEEATNKLQCAIKKVVGWTRKWRIKLNENKSQNV